MSDNIASSSGITGLPGPIVDGKLVQSAADERGRLWTRLFVDGAPVSQLNPLPVVTAAGGAVAVVGLIAHDTADDEATNKPVKTGGHATAAPRPDVSADDIADTSVDLAGRTRVRVSSPGGDTSTTNEALFVGGDEANDAVDAGNPIKIGCRAVANIGIGIVPAVAPGDRVDLAADITGHLGVAALGTVGHGGIDAGAPVKIGARAAASTAGFTPEAPDDRVDIAADVSGRLIVVTAPAITSPWTVLAPTVGNASGQLIIKASAGTLRRLFVSNTSATIAFYLQLHDTAAVGTIATGTRRSVSVPLPAGGFVEIDFGDAPLPFVTGIAVALSTTDTTYTAGSTTGDFSGQYA